MKKGDLPPDKKVGPFLWNHQAILGSGSFGKVYIGKDERSKDYIENKDISDPYLQQALKNEVKILNSLKSPNVVRMIDCLQTANRTYIIQEFCDGGEMRGYLTKNAIDESKAIKILHDILNGMEEMVSMNYVHRDLKPENVADFGFAKKVQNFNSAMLQTACGTPLYMAPQVIKNENYSTKSDIWSIGVMYFEMLFGKTPWPARTEYELVQKMTVFNFFVKLIRLFQLVFQQTSQYLQAVEILL